MNERDIFQIEIIHSGSNKPNERYFEFGWHYKIFIKQGMELILESQFPFKTEDDARSEATKIQMALLKVMGKTVQLIKSRMDRATRKTTSPQPTNDPPVDYVLLEGEGHD